MYELSWGCLSTSWKPEPGHSECCLYSTISSSRRLAKSLHGSVCYYRDVLPNCCLPLYTLILFTWEMGGLVVVRGAETSTVTLSWNVPADTFCQFNPSVKHKHGKTWLQTLILMDNQNIATSNFIGFSIWESLETWRIFTQTQNICFGKIQPGTANSRIVPWFYPSVFVALQSAAEQNIHQSRFLSCNKF